MTSDQLSIFDVMRAPPVVPDFDLEDSVVTGPIDEVLILPHPRMAWNQAEIELHRLQSGLWMWSTEANRGTSGWGYRVGGKWNNFAETRDDALFYAIKEMRQRIKGSLNSYAADNCILAWLETLQ